jgi:F-type H+-transporting ATPase subunit delta
MAEVATLARPYANAVFDVAKSAGDLDRWSRMLGCLSSTAQDDKVQRMLEAPDMASEQKAFRLVELCGDELNDKARKFVQVLAGNKRLSLLTEIYIQYATLYALEQRSLDVAVISAYPLTQDEQVTLKASLRVRFDKEISMTSEVDSNLIGGAIIRAGDTVIDGSIRGKLDKLAATIQRT